MKWLIHQSCLDSADGKLELNKDDLESYKIVQELTYIKVTKDGQKFPIFEDVDLDDKLKDQDIDDEIRTLT